MPIEQKQRVAKASGTQGTLVPLGTIVGVMDSILTGEEAVWVRLNDGITPEKVMDCEVYVRVEE